MDEKYFEDKVRDYTCSKCVSEHIRSISSDESTIRRIHRLVSLVYIHGAELGYKMSNEWHYPSKGEYPKDDTVVLVAYYTRFNLDTKQPSGELQCKVAGFLGKKWYNNDTGCGDIDDWLNKPDMVYAWKEIVLPELSKDM